MQTAHPTGLPARSTKGGVPLPSRPQPATFPKRISQCIVSFKRPVWPSLSPLILLSCSLFYWQTSVNNTGWKREPAKHRSESCALATLRKKSQATGPGAQIKTQVTEKGIDSHLAKSYGPSSQQLDPAQAAKHREAAGNSCTSELQKSGEQGTGGDFSLPPQGELVAKGALHRLLSKGFGQKSTTLHPERFLIRDSPVRA